MDEVSRCFFFFFFFFIYLFIKRERGFAFEVLKKKNENFIFTEMLGGARKKKEGTNGLNIRCHLFSFKRRINKPISIKSKNMRVLIDFEQKNFFFRKSEVVTRNFFKKISNLFFCFLNKN